MYIHTLKKNCIPRLQATNMIDSKSDELDWIKVREDLDENFIAETIYAKAKRKIRENPFVPIGKLTSNNYDILRSI